jgi:lysophospholipase L1-like esterase
LRYESGRGYSINMTTLLAFGDSITWGAWDTEGGWVARLRKEIDKRNLSDPEFYCSVYNLGISGETSSALLKRFSSEAKHRIKIEEENPIIIIATGTNDAKFIKSKNTHLVPLEEYQKNIIQLIKQLKTITSNALFLTPPFVNESNVNVSSKGDERLLFNKDLSQYARVVKEETLKRKIPCIDVQQFFNEKTMLDIDGVHPNDKGHEEIYKHLKEILNKRKILEF